MASSLLTVTKPNPVRVVDLGRIGGSGQLIDSSTGLPDADRHQHIHRHDHRVGQRDGGVGALPGPVMVGSSSSLSGVGRIGPLASTHGIIEPGLRSLDGFSIVQPGTLATVRSFPAK